MKAILVIDFPEEYDVADLRMVYIVGDSEGNVVKVQRELIPCLKPMPEPKPIKQEIMGEDYYIGFYGQGWNDCIEELEK